MARLLHGMTDALTPVNLLPNSDFSRGGGYPATQTFTTLSPNSSVYITANHRLHFFDGNFNNLTVTVSKNSVKITGNTTVSGSRIYMYYSNPNQKILIDVKEYTMEWDVLDESSGTVLYQFEADHAGNNYFARNRLNQDNSHTLTYCHIRTEDIGDSSHNSYLMPKFTIQYVGYFSIEIRNLCLYRGLLTNPPKWSPSLDVCYNNQFALARTSVDSYKKVAGSSTPHWYRIFNFAVDEYDHVYLFIEEHRTLIEIEQCTTSPNVITLKAKVLSNDNSSSCIIQKFRQRQYNGSVYVEAYINSSTDFTVGFVFDKCIRVRDLPRVINITTRSLLMTNGDGDTNLSGSFDVTPDFSYFS